MELKQKWDLDCFYEGGSNSATLKKALENFSSELKKLGQEVQAKGDLKEAILMLQDLSLQLHEMARVISCLNAQDVTDTKAHLLQDQVTGLSAECANISVMLDEWLSSTDQTTFSSLLEESELKPIAFAIKERRHLAQEKLSAKEEAFINDLAVDGFHGWPQMWDAMIGNMTFPIGGEAFSFSQIENQIADPSREKRQAAFQSIDTTFRKKQILFAQTLNHLAGFRLAVYKKRGWKKVLKEPLEDNRMQEKTLQVMWRVINSHQDKLKAYMKCKADLLKVSELSWCDLEAPIGEVTKKVSYDEAAQFIIKHFTHFSPQMGQFAKEVLHGEWIDAEDRVNKYPGGFCVSMPVSKQSRIFMTYANTRLSV